MAWTCHVWNIDVMYRPESSPASMPCIQELCATEDPTQPKASTELTATLPPAFLPRRKLK